MLDLNRPLHGEDFSDGIDVRLCGTLAPGGIWLKSVHAEEKGR
jgi:hypothetical protein